MYKSEYIFKNNLTIEVIKHNNNIIIKYKNNNKGIYIGYNLNNAIKEFKKTYNK